MKTFLKVILAFVLFFFWIIFQILGGILGGVFCAGIVLFFCSWICRAKKSKEKELSGTFDSYAGAYGAMTPEEISKILLNTELSKYERPVVRSVVKRRSILVLIGIIINFLLITFFYHTGYCILLCSLLALVSTVIWCRFSNLSMLCKAAIEAPHKSFSAIAEDELCSEEQMIRSNRIKWGLIGLAVVSLAGFFILHSTPKWQFSETASGYVVEKYRPQAGNHSEVEIPRTYNGKEVVAIGDNAFKGLGGITSVTMPDSVLTVGNRAFYNCSALEQIDLSDNLVSIGSGAFRDCSALKSVTLPQSLTELLGESFMNCSSLTSVTIPKSVTEIRGNTFDGCTDLEEVILHDGIVDIHAYAFQRCASLKQIQLPASITEIHTYTFAECTSLEQIEIPSGVTRIAARAFFHCTGLKEVFIPDTVLEIRSSAFRECTALKEIFLPSGISVDEKAFKDSPTQLKNKPFSDELSEQIDQEIADKDVDTYYYIYEPQSPDTIHLWNYGTTLIVDDPSFAENLDSHQALGALDGAQGLLEHLEAVKSKGITQVMFAGYSQLATDATGEPYFAGYLWQIDDMIEECRRMIAEETDG